MRCVHETWVAKRRARAGTGNMGRARDILSGTGKARLPIVVFSLMTHLHRLPYKVEIFETDEQRG